MPESLKTFTSALEKIITTINKLKKKTHQPMAKRVAVCDLLAGQGRKQCTAGSGEERVGIAGFGSERWMRVKVTIQHSAFSTVLQRQRSVTLPAEKGGGQNH